MVYEGLVEDLIFKQNYDISKFCREDVEYRGHVPEKEGQRKGHNLSIVFYCSVCARDPELYGEGLFIARAGHVSARMCCGCSKKATYNENQWEIISARKAAENGFSFSGWFGDFRGSDTRSIFCCKEHGNWESPRLSVIHKNRIYCPKCQEESTGIKRHYSNPVTEEDFFATGKYHPDTQFTRLGPIKYEKGRKSRTVYWQVDCPVCETLAVAQSDSLKNGRCSCSCSYLSGQVQAYINIVMDGDFPVAIKFGISKNYKNRIANINYKKTPLKLKLYKLFVFKDRKSCLDAERYCKENLLCHVVSKNDIGCGYTETTKLSNIETVEQIYRNFGGEEVLLDQFN